MIAVEWDDDLDVQMSWIDLRSVADLVRVVLAETATALGRGGSRPMDV